jgi:hypothetical protein
MARIWSEPYNETHRTRMAWEFGESEGAARHHRAPTLEPHHVLFVRVAGFTFEFHSVEQLRACQTYYAAKHHPSSRLPVGTGEYGGDHSEVQRWFERLPLYLREEPKRLQVVTALDDALHRVALGEFALAAV